jgi:hypothetical protein
MASAIEVILIPTLMILFGFALKQKGFFKKSDRDLLSNIVLYISLPSMIFINLYNADISKNMVMLPVLGVILSCTLAVIAYFYCRIRGYSKKTRWTIIIASSIMNTGFIGFPVSLGVYGNTGFLHAVFFDLSTSALIIIYGILLAKEFGGNRREVITRAVTFMPVWGVIFAMIFNFLNLPLPYIADSILNYFGQSTIPLIMLCLGLSLDFENIGNNLSDSLVVSFLKLAVSPLIMLMLLMSLKISGIAFNIGILEAGMSTAMNALVLAITYDLDADLMGSMIFTNVILSVFTLTGIIILLA